MHVVAIYFFMLQIYLYMTTIWDIDNHNANSAELSLRADNPIITLRKVFDPIRHWSNPCATFKVPQQLVAGLC